MVKNVGRARNWPLWAGDHFTEVTVKAGLTVNHLAEKIFCNILFSKFLTRFYILFFEPSSSIADSGTVWLDTYIKIIVDCRDISQTLRKL